MGQPVLVVDDNAVNRRVVRELLTSWGLASGEAASGETALAALREAAAAGRPYRTAVLDEQMPGMDGLGLGRPRRAGRPRGGRARPRPGGPGEPGRR